MAASNYPLINAISFHLNQDISFQPLQRLLQEQQLCLDEPLWLLS